jgi:hypothetical protein
VSITTLWAWCAHPSEVLGFNKCKCSLSSACGNKEIRGLLFDWQVYYFPILYYLCILFFVNCYDSFSLSFWFIG